MAFLDPPAPEQLPRGVVTWPLAAVAALAVVVSAIAEDHSLGLVLSFAVVAQLATLAIAFFMARRLLATGATRPRLVRIVAIGVIAALSAVFAAATTTRPLMYVEVVSAAIALLIATRAAMGLRRIAPS